MASLCPRRPARFLLLLMLATASSPARTQTHSLQDEISQHEEKLRAARGARSMKEETSELVSLGSLHLQAGETQKAMECFDQALQAWRRLGNRNGEALTLNNMGKAYAGLGQEQKALELYDQALPIWREGSNHRGEASSLTNMGRVYSDLGQKQKALELYNQALPYWREVGEHNGEALALNDIGRIYLDLGQQQKALDFYNQALAIWRSTGNRHGEASTLNNIGRAYSDMGQKQKALEFYNQALPAWREAGDRSGEALTLNNIGRALVDMGQKQKGLEFYYQALPIWRETGNRRGEAATLTNIGMAYESLGQKQNVLPNELAALSLAKAVDDPDLQGKIDASLMRYFHRQQRPEMAIPFGVDAVNSFQQIRKNISGLDKDLQSSFAQSKSGSYRELAELLVQADRLGEAEKVLDLLKEQELKEVVQGARDQASKVEPLPPAPELEVPEKAAVALTSLNMEYAALQAKESRSPAEEARLKTLDAQVEAGNKEVSAFFHNTLYTELAHKVGTEDANALLSKEKSDVSRLQNTLAELGPRVLGIRLLLGEEHVYAIVVTPHTREKVELKATPAELRSKVLEVRDELRTPTSDPKLHLSELYAMVVAPLSSQLKALEGRGGQDRAPTILWSLDGVLRYLPMAALYDGNRYMVERFNNVLFTPESYGHMTTGPASGLRVLAMGLSKSYGGLPALPGVMPELEAVVHDPAVPESHGPIDGKLLPNEQFTLAALKTQLGSSGSFPVVHIASHFVEETGTGEEPYLMLGGNDVGEAEGYELTLSKMENSSISFHGTQLLTLSACSTAKGDAAKDGLEMDSLGMIAQQKDAAAVLATLWDVNDASTSRLMSDFYSRWVKIPADGKAEALRQAQIAFRARAQIRVCIE